MDSIDLRLADIVLVKGSFLFSLGIKLMSQSEFSHASLVFNPETKQLIEAELKGGVMYGNLENYIGHAIILRNENLTDEQRKDIVKFAKEQLGKPFDIVEVINQFLRYAFHIPDNHVEKTRFICSTLVNASYLSTGIKLTNQNMPSPEDIYESPLLTKITDI